MRGEKHGKRTCLREVDRSRFGRRQVSVRCDCGREDTVDLSGWRRGKANECPLCRSARCLAARQGIHGWSRSSEYQSWLAMRRRCRDEKFWKFPDYGGRGITVCDEWYESFPAFIEHVGEKPSPRHTLDRIDNDGNYEPGNVRWATPQEQRLNQTRAEISMQYGLLIRTCIYKGSAFPMIVPRRLEPAKWEDVYAPWHCLSA